MSSNRIIKEAQDYMRNHPPLPSDTKGGQEGIWGGWLIHDYRQSNPIFRQLLQSPELHSQASGMITRPCFLFIPSAGEPRLLVHHVDAGKFRQMGIDPTVYSNRQTMVQGMRDLLPSGGRVAMEYSPLGALPRASKVDAGTVELVRSLGVEVVSSADLLQYSTQRWSEAQLSSHTRSAEKLGRIVLGAFDYIGRNLANGPAEYQVAEFIRGRFQEEGLHSPTGPIVAVNRNASDPHYEPSPVGSSAVQ